MVVFYNKQVRLSLVAALMSLSNQANADLYKAIVPLPADQSQNKDWEKGLDVSNSYMALGYSRGNIAQYYKESRTRYGGLPTQDKLDAAEKSWFTYLQSNIPTLSIYIGMLERNNNPPHNGGGWTVVTPQIPLINRVVTPISYKKNVDHTGFRKPLLPPMRLSRDGRIGLVPGSGGLDGKPQPLRIHLNSPEKLSSNLLESAAGVPTIADTFEVKDYSKWGLPGSKTTHFVSICEGKPEKIADRNPYACGVGGLDDCYHLTLVGSAVQESFSTSALYDLEGGYRTLYMPQLEKMDKLYSRKMTIRVSQPKTANAKIAAVDFDANEVPKQAPIRQGVLYELNTPADGRVLVTRRQGLPLVWKHGATGEVRVGSYETVYAVAPESATPCDASQWGDLRPISHAPFDPNMKKRYDFAKYPFRDPMGNLIADGDDIKATYPWLDMDAKNLSLMISDANLFRDGALFDKSRFNNRCVHSGCTPSDSKDKSNISQFTIMGAWTKGKMSIMDNKINYADFRINLANALYLDLYQPNSALANTLNKSASVEVGGYREVGGGTEKDVVIPLQNHSVSTYLVKNTSLFDSIENRMNFNPNMKPARPNDVVWTLSSGATSDEFSFDDLLNNNAFIISDMVAAYTWVNNNQFRMTGYDGWNELLGAWTGQVKVQNAATTLPEVWKVPDSGDIVHGRIEPVANGGIKGKGMYFNGSNTRILYNIPSNQPRPLSQSSWFHSLFIDAREVSKTVERVIIDFPDKSRLTMVESGDGKSINFYGYNNHGERQVGTAVPSSLVKQRWFNFALQTMPSKNSSLFVNGYPYGDLVPLAGSRTGGSLFQMTSGALVLGRAHHSYDINYEWIREGFLDWQRVPTATPVNYGAFKGWMDEYKLFSYQPDVETACNMAHGTLVTTGTNQNMIHQASLYSASMHQKVSSVLRANGKSTASSYACYMGSPNHDETAVMHSIPLGTLSIRADIHFPEGPLYHNVPRPDSKANTFCLACHTDASHNLISGLSVNGALGWKNIPAKMDVRRQPTQPPAIVTGNMPQKFIDSIKIKGNNISGSYYIDDYIMPSKK